MVIKTFLWSFAFVFLMFFIRNIQVNGTPESRRLNAEFECFGKVSESMRRDEPDNEALKKCIDLMNYHKSLK